MKLHFEANLDYQLQAIEAVCDLFRGQELGRTEFTVLSQIKTSAGDLLHGSVENDRGLGNRLSLLDDDLLRNLNEVQQRQGLRPCSDLKSGDFTVEMETGTGKTYVYLRSIFELNKRYGFTKFMIVVPSVAIKEGVYKSLQIMEEHFRSLYAGVPFEYFLYDSGKLGQVRNFATSSQIQIMVVTVGSINKKEVNNLYKDTEKTGGEQPIELIKATNPIVIVDEPQSVDGGLEGRGKDALQAMNPLCTLRYSATHIDKHHMLYRLDAVDAYERKLVKQIEVASATVEGAQNKAFIRFIGPVMKGKKLEGGRVELDVQTKSGIKRREVTVNDGDDLEQSTGREIYRDMRIGEIRGGKDAHLELRFPGGEEFLLPGQAHGDVDDLAIKREMIRRTIREHLDKEKRLRPQGIKVLSLFFIDSVSKYRSYDKDGQVLKGDYAHIFEEEYRRFAKHPDYVTLFKEVDLSAAAEQVHDGYFSIDKNGGWTETSENNAGNRDNAERAYNLIMKDKERLLSFETPLKFIFSHSALKEGWDNPNVFQICSLRDMGTERQRRQTIGRGLRLCVNQHGERVRGFEVNTLTVIATEDYEDFAENLQKEISEDTGIRFGLVEDHQFAGVSVADEDYRQVPLGQEGSQAIWKHLLEQNLIDKKGKIQDGLKTALKNRTLQLPPQFEKHQPQVEEILRKLAGRLEVKNADDKKVIPTRRAVLDSEEFKALWERIKHKTTYRVEFDNDKLLESCISKLQQAQPIHQARMHWRKAGLSIGKGGINTKEGKGSQTVNLDEGDIELPDILGILQDKTKLTRRSLLYILQQSLRLDDFEKNPQQFLELATDIIRRCKRQALVDGIRYQRLGDSEYYAQELFQTEELTGYLSRNMLAAEKAPHEYVVYGSETEREFALQLEHNDAVKVYAKLPNWFKIPTPLGNYNPDWAVLIDKDGQERLYFVVETKSSLFSEDLRFSERDKISCGKVHFATLGGVKYKQATRIEDVLS